MSKKVGTVIKIVTVVAGIAAVGTACYVYRDKIKEFFEKLNLKEKVDTAKSFVSDKFLSAKDEDFFDDADFFDDEAVDEDDNSNRGYTSINITSEESEESIPVTSSVSRESKQDLEELKPVNVKGEEDEEGLAFEYEGLSDVSEDEDVLAEESALDG